MLALALALLFAVTGIAAVLVIIDSAMKGRNAWTQLMREAALMRAGYAVQVEAQELRVRRAPARFTPDRRLTPLRPLPVCVAA